MIKAISFKWQNGLTLNDTDYPTFIRGDTVNVTGYIQGDSANLSVKATVNQVIQGSMVLAWTLDSQTSGIALNALNTGLSYVVVNLIDKVNTTPYDPGSQFVFDLEFETTSERQTIKSGFSISEDYTTNS